MTACTETEKLLMSAQEIANRTLREPDNADVMEIFRELCAERDRTAWATDGREQATVH